MIFLFSLFCRNITKLTCHCNCKTQPNTRCIFDCTSLIPRGSNIQHSRQYCPSYNANCHSNINLTVTKPLEPVEKPHLDVIELTPNHQYLKPSLTTINCISCKHDLNISDFENMGNSHCLIRNVSMGGPTLSPRKLCSRSVKIPHEIVPSKEASCEYLVGKLPDIPSESLIICSTAPIPGCECCSVSESNCNNLNVAPKRSLSSPSPHYYGYDSEYSGAETEIHCSDRSFDSQSFDIADQTAVTGDILMNTESKVDQNNIENVKPEEIGLKTVSSLKSSFATEGSAHSPSEKEEGVKLKYLEIEDENVVSVLKESHSVEVLGSYNTEQITDSAMFLKCTIPSRSASADGDLVNDSGAEDGGYLSSVSDRINADSCSDDVSTNHIDKNHKFQDKISKGKKSSSEETQITLNSLNKTNNKSNVYKVNNSLIEVKKLTNIESINDIRKQNELIMIEKNHSKTEYENGDYDHDSAISSRRSSTLMPCKNNLPFSVCEIMSHECISQSDDNIPGDINNEKLSVKTNNHIISSVANNCDTCNTNLPGPVLSVVHSNWICDNKKSISSPTDSDSSCCSIMPENTVNRESLPCFSLITESKESRKPPDGEVECKNIDQYNSRFLDRDFDNTIGCFEYCQIKNDRVTGNIGFDKVKINNYETTINTSSCEFADQNDYIEFSYCRCSTVEKQPVDISCTDNGDANCLPLLMSHADPPSPSIPQNNMERDKSSVIITKKLDDTASTNEYSDYGSSSGGGGGQRMTSHHSGAQGANSGSGSKRNAFTRSLSNADVPPDEKAGKNVFLIYNCIINFNS